MGQLKSVIGRTVYPRGAWVSGTDYKQFNIVMNKGSVFMATQDSPSAEPTVSYDAATGVYTVSAGWALWAYGYTADFADDVSANLQRIHKTLGHYSDRKDITLTATETGVAISAAGVKVTKSGWAIAEFEAEKGVEYLFKPGTIDSNVCIFAQKVTSKEIHSIDYTYTYDENGNVSKAVATYNGATHTYTYAYTYDEGTGNITDTTITDEKGTIVTSLPYQYESSIGSYLPMTRLNAGAELPEDGYCRLMSHFQGNASLKVVVSYKVGSADLTMRAVKDGVFASVATQLGNLSQNIASTQSALSAEETVGTQALAEIYRLLSMILTNLGAIKAESITTKYIPMVNGFPAILFGAGVPAAATVPENWDGEAMGIWTGVPLFKGQVYIDTTATEHGHYDAVHCDSVSGWKNA